MRKLNLLTLFALLAAVSVAFTSCGFGDEPSFNDVSDYKLTEWVEPYANLSGSINDVKAYMSAKQPRYELALEKNNNGIAVLLYVVNGKHTAAINYSFLEGKLQGVTVSEFMVNLDLVVNCLKKKYIMNTVSPEDSVGVQCLYKFTNEQGTLEIKLYKSSEEVFGLIYNRI